MIDTLACPRRSLTIFGLIPEGAEPHHPADRARRRRPGRATVTTRGAGSGGSSTPPGSGRRGRPPGNVRTSRGPTSSHCPSPLALIRSMTDGWPPFRQRSPRHPTAGQVPRRDASRSWPAAATSGTCPLCARPRRCARRQPSTAEHRRASAHRHPLLEEQVASSTGARAGSCAPAPGAACHRLQHGGPAGRSARPVVPKPATHHGRPNVTVAIDERVEALYAELWNVLPGNDGGTVRCRRRCPSRGAAPGVGAANGLGRHRCRSPGGKPSSGR